MYDADGTRISAADIPNGATILCDQKYRPVTLNGILFCLSVGSVPGCCDAVRRLINDSSVHLRLVSPSDPHIKDVLLEDTVIILDPLFYPTQHQA